MGSKVLSGPEQSWRKGAKTWRKKAKVSTGPDQERAWDQAWRNLQTDYLGD